MDIDGPSYAHEILTSQKSDRCAREFGAFGRCNCLKGRRRDLITCAVGGRGDPAPGVSDAKWRGRHFARTWFEKRRTNRCLRGFVFFLDGRLLCRSCDGLLLRRSWSRGDRWADSPLEALRDRVLAVGLCRLWIRIVAGCLKLLDFVGADSRQRHHLWIDP